MLSIPKKSYWIIDLILIGGFLSLFYALGLGSYPLFTPDEGRYSEVAREMVMNRNYITPHLNGVIFLDKPILYYWLQASAIYWFGLKEWALRFWPATVGILGCLITYLTGHALFNRRTGLLAAWILATSPLYFGGAHYANLDLEVAVFISCSLMLFILGIEFEKKSLFALAYVFTSLAFLTKGLIGLVFPGMIVCLWIILSNQWGTLKKMHLFLGLFLFIVLSTPWYFLVQKHNPQFFHYFFVVQQYSRFLTKGDFNNQAAFLFYVPIVALGFIPWTLFLPQAFVATFQSIKSNRLLHRKELFFMIWAIFVFIFFSIPKSKTIGYILPIFPPLAIIVSNVLSQYWDNLKQPVTYSGIIFYVLTAILLGSLLLTPYPYAYIPRQFASYLILLSCTLILSSIFIYYFLRIRQLKKCIYTIFFSSLAFLLILIASASLVNHNSIKSLALQLKPRIQPHDEIASYQKYFQDLPIYLEKRITIISDWHSENIPRTDNWQRELWLGMPYQDTREWLIEEPEFWQRWSSHRRIYVFMYQEYLPHFLYMSSIIKKTTYVIGSNQTFALVTNRL